MTLLPVEPPPTRWRLPEPELADDDGIEAISANTHHGQALSSDRAGRGPQRA